MQGSVSEAAGDKEVTHVGVRDWAERTVRSGVGILEITPSGAHIRLHPGGTRLAGRWLDRNVLHRAADHSGVADTGR
jgi:hypothetical protein